MKIALFIAAILVGIFIVTEMGLRWCFGFGSPLIYIPDEQIGYLLAPNQKTRRFGNRIEINEYSMRSEPMPALRDSSTLRVLLLGDSVVNGGWWTDQSEIISAQIAHQLRLDPLGFRQVQMLNASANSWGPRNELAYLERFGTFDAQIVVLVINTDDLFATAPTSLPVGQDRNYPDHRPALAIIEVLRRYLWPVASVSPELIAVQNEAGDRVGRNLTAIQKMQALVQQAGGSFILAMTPLLRELSESGPLDYEKVARERIQKLVTSASIEYLDFLEIFQQAQQPAHFYRDHIHLSALGNQRVSETLNRQIQKNLPKG